MQRRLRTFPPHGGQASKKIAYFWPIGPYARKPMSSINLSRRRILHATINENILEHKVFFAALKRGSTTPIIAVRIQACRFF
jgi:hypothetical protein